MALFGGILGGGVFTQRTVDVPRSAPTKRPEVVPFQPNILESQTSGTRPGNIEISTKSSEKSAEQKRAEIVQQEKSKVAKAGIFELQTVEPKQNRPNELALLKVDKPEEGTEELNRLASLKIDYLRMVAEAKMKTFSEDPQVQKYGNAAMMELTAGIDDLLANQGLSPDASNGFRIPFEAINALSKDQKGESLLSVLNVALKKSTLSQVSLVYELRNAAIENQVKSADLAKLQPVIGLSDSVVRRAYGGDSSGFNYAIDNPR
jgi:hypothetical protein